ncbi:MAG: hypothetical protein LBG81_01510, partial [Coriobacteriaceae bacterium]|nr:hypothetical protein [Coriobacteriaceae bacterium]
MNQPSRRKASPATGRARNAAQHRPDAAAASRPLPRDAGRPASHAAPARKRNDVPRAGGSHARDTAVPSYDTWGQGGATGARTRQSLGTRTPPNRQMLWTNEG